MLSDVFYSIYSHFLVKYPSRGKIFRSFLGGRLESFSLQTQFSALENNFALSMEAFLSHYSVFDCHLGGPVLPPWAYNKLL